MKTVYAKPEEMTRTWYVVDAEGKRLGRVAATIAAMLRGKNKPFYAPHQECGDYIVVVNADKIQVTGRKYDDKMYYHHTMYPGGLKEHTYAQVVSRDGAKPLEIAIRGMLPKGPLGRKLYQNVKVYAGPVHPHAAQQPVALEL